MHIFAKRPKDLTGAGLLQDFFKNDPFMDLFGSGGGGLFGEPVKDRKPRYSASKYRPRSKSLFRYFGYIFLYYSLLYVEVSFFGHFESRNVP